MLGAIVGDVIGSRFKHSSLKPTEFRLFDPNCRCTDDSILTIATADALIHPGDYRIAYQDYFHRYPNVGHEGRFIVWAKRRSTIPFNSSGYGAATRASPIGWAFDDLDAVLDEAQRSAEVSHYHSGGVIGAQAVAAAVFLARTSHDRDLIRRVIRYGCLYPIDQTIEEMRLAYVDDASCKGNVTVAIRAFLDSTDFESAIRLAVSVGGASDTIACITGAIAHAYYGMIPSHMTEPIFKSFLTDELAQVTRDFCTRYSVPL